MTCLCFAAKAIPIWCSYNNANKEDPQKDQERGRGDACVTVCTSIKTHSKSQTPLKCMIAWIGVN